MLVIQWLQWFMLCKFVRFDPCSYMNLVHTSGPMCPGLGCDSWSCNYKAQEGVDGTINQIFKFGPNPIICSINLKKKKKYMFSDIFTILNPSSIINQNWNLICTTPSSSNPMKELSISTPSRSHLAFDLLLFHIISSSLNFFVWNCSPNSCLSTNSYNRSWTVPF